jgi:hypothetical protein
MVGGGQILTLGLLAMAAATACGHLGKPRAVALYPNPDQRRAPHEIATLYGPIGSVDGRSVGSQGSRFELLPGCHVVTLRPRIGETSSSGTSAWMATLPPLVYAFRMRASHSYGIEHKVEHSSGPYGRFMLTAVEKGPDGAVVQPLGPAGGEDDIQACRQWESGQ